MHIRYRPPPERLYARWPRSFVPFCAGVAASLVDGGRRPSSPRRLDSLTGLRFLAALAVFANHAGDHFLADSASPSAGMLATGRAGPLLLPPQPLRAHVVVDQR